MSGAEIVLQLSSPTVIEIFQNGTQAAKFPLSEIWDNSIIPFYRGKLPSSKMFYWKEASPENRPRYYTFRGSRTRCLPPSISRSTKYTAGATDATDATDILTASSLTAGLIAEAELRPGSDRVQDFNTSLRGASFPDGLRSPPLPK